MAQGILVLGKSGSGKSTSVRNLNPLETFIVNVVNKPLPFKGWKNNYTKYNKETNPNGNMVSTDKVDNIQKVLDYINDSRKEIKVVIIDDSQYTMGNEYMRRAKESGYNKFTDIGQSTFNLVNKISTLRDDLYIVFLHHLEVEKDELGNQQIQAKTIGKMFTQYVTFEGLFSIVLYTHIAKDDKGLHYGFLTQSDGTNTAKSPMGMFDSLIIDNDLKYVIEKIEEYNN